MNELIYMIISIVSGAVGGNVAGAAAPEKSLGGIGNSLAGLVGGGLTSYILQAMDILGKMGVLPTGAEGAGAAAAAAPDIGSILANIGTSGVGGALLTFIIGLIKSGLGPNTK